MTQIRINTGIAVAALVVALLGTTGLGQAAPTSAGKAQGFSKLEVVTKSQPSGQNGNTLMLVDCPVGKRLISGMASTDTGYEGTILQYMPLSDSTLLVRAKNPNSTYTLHGYATCAKAT